VPASNIVGFLETYQTIRSVATAWFLTAPEILPQPQAGNSQGGFLSRLPLLAEIVESLTELIETKPLSFGERGTLERAKRLLICEISEVTGTTKQEAEAQVDLALIGRIRTVACAV